MVEDVTLPLRLTVIICTHNPNESYLDRVLGALKSQTLLKNKWEILLVDNASQKKLSDAVDLSWHPVSRHVREDKLGLTPARLRGIKEAQANTLVFVDDDNVLDPDYLEVALNISNNYPWIGAWGGQSRPEFEVEPPEWTKPYWDFLAIRELERNQWSNLLHQNYTTPSGAGICVRKSVAEAYAGLIQNNSKRLELGRKGSRLTSSEDLDLAYTACDIGLGTGLFKDLKLTHLISANRLSEEYLTRLVEGVNYSLVILNSFRRRQTEPPNLSWRARLLNWYSLWRMRPEHRRIARAAQKGQWLAIQDLKRISPL